MVKIQNSNLSRIIGIIRPILFFITLALAIAWIYGVPNVEPWTYLFGLIVALLEGVSLIQQFQPDPQSRQARQLEELSFSLKQYPGVLSYVETLVKTGETTDTALSKILKTTPRFVLTGVSGSGKTTALCKTALEIAQEALEGIDQQRKTSPIPFVVYFSQWGGKQSLEDFLQEQWTYEGTAIEVIAKTNIWFFGDGLDELPKDAPAKIEEINRWLNGSNGPHRAFFTCRIPHYNDGLQLSLPVVEIPEELSKTQIEQFAKEYLGKDATNFLSAFYVAPEPWASESLFSAFLKTPLFLTVLLQNYRQGTDNHIVGNPGRQVDNYVREIWHREQNRHPAKKISLTTMAGACAYLANETHRLNARTSSHDVSEAFSKQDAIAYLTHGLLQTAESRRNKRFDTIYLSAAIPFLFLWFIFGLATHILSNIRRNIYFKYIRKDPNFTLKVGFEYLTPRAIWQNFSLFWKEFKEDISNSNIAPFEPRFWVLKRLAPAILDDLINIRILRSTEGGYDFSHGLLFYYFLAQMDLIQGKADNPSELGRTSNWRRATYRDDIRTILLASLAPDSDDFIVKISTHDPYVAAKCIAYRMKVNASTRECVINNLLHVLVSNGDGHEWLVVETVTALNSLADPSIVNDLLDAADNTHFNPIHESIIQALVKLHYDAVPALIRLLPNCNVNASRVAIRALSLIGDPRAIQSLERWIECNPDHYNYLWAMAALSHLGHEPSKQIYFDQHLRYQPSSKHIDISSRCQAWRAFCQTASNHSHAFQELFDLATATSEESSEEYFVRGCFYQTVRHQHLLDTTISNDLINAYQSTKIVQLRRDLIVLLAERNVTEASIILAEDIYNPELASSIIEAMGNLKFDNADVVNAIIGYLGHPEAYFRHQAIIALGKIGNPEAALPLSKLLTDEDGIRANTTNAQLAAEALLDLGTPIAKDKAADYYIARLELAEYDTGSWHFAESKLRQIGTEKAIKAIEEANQKK